MNTSEDLSNNIVPQSCIDTLYELIRTRNFFCVDGSLEKALSRLEGKQYTAVEYSSKPSGENTQTLRIIMCRGLNQKTIKHLNNEIHLLTSTHQLLILHVLDENDENDKKLDIAIRAKDDRITYYTDHDISHNILKHKWVPLHEKIDKREKQYITQIYNLRDEKQLPLISVEDPVITFHGWQCGDIVRITRKPLLCPRSGPASKHIGSGCGTYISYRYVTKIRQDEL